MSGQRQTEEDSPQSGNHEGAAIGASGPLARIRILDLSSVVMGPLATQMLGDLGADVIAVETLDGGMNRDLGRKEVHQGLSGMAVNLFRNKRSLSANLKDPDVHAAVLKLGSTCDVVVTNLRPDARRRLRLDHPDLAAVRPDIIYCAAQGFSSDSERANDPAYDDIIQAETGIADAASKTGRDPILAPTILADKVSAMAIVNAVLAALFHRERTGRGQYVEVPMSDVLRAFMLVELGGDAIRRPGAPVGYPRVFSPTRGPQKTKDGWINMLPYSAADYDALFLAGRLHELVGGEKTAAHRAIVENAAFLYGKVREIALTRTSDEWFAFCKAKGIPVGRVGKLEELVAELPTETHPHVGPYQHIPPGIRFTDCPPAMRRHAPFLGQDSVAVLTEAGLSRTEIDALAQRGAINIADVPTKDDAPSCGGGD